MTPLWTISRRRWLAGSAATLLPIGSGAFAASAPEAHGRLIVVFLRGAVDGLNVVVPHGDPNYAVLRPTISVPATGALDLDGYFGLHPALDSVMPLWRDKTMAFVHASGSPDPSRSHFDAQDFMESGTPGDKNTADGWMNRLLGALPGAHKPTDAIAFSPTLPRILSGPLPVSSVPNGRSAAAEIPLDRPMISAAFDKLYTGDDALARAYREGIEAHQKMLTDLKDDMKEADAGAPLPNGFAADAEKLAKLMRQDPTITLGFFALGGWDTHINQGGAEGQLAQRLRPLGEGLVTLARELGPLYQQTTVLVISEFGRTAHENGNRGTDHGHGNVMWVMGGRIAGGRVYGQWPGLAPEALYQKRDLAVTTDFRSVIAAVLAKHMGLDAPALARVFPQMPEMPVSLGSLVNA